MMHPHEIDPRLRRAFEADPESVERVIGAVAAGVPDRRPLAGRRLRYAVAAVGLLLAIVVWSRPFAPRQPVPAGVTAWFADDAIVVPLDDGSVAIVGPGARDDRPPDGLGIVIVLGEDR